MSRVPASAPAVLYSETVIHERVRALAAQISADHADADVLYLIGVLKGSFIFLADLVRHLTVPHRVEFVALQSYGDRGTVQGEVRLLMDLRESIAGRRVVVVEDIVDTGKTLRHLLDLLHARQPATLRTCALVRKKARLQADVTVDYLGFDIPDEWVVGYGLDYKEAYRTLPYIGVVRPT